MLHDSVTRGWGHAWKPGSTRLGTRSEKENISDHGGNISPSMLFGPTAVVKIIIYHGCYEFSIMLLF